MSDQIKKEMLSSIEESPTSDRATELEAENKKLRQQFSSLQGKYNKEVKEVLESQQRKPEPAHEAPAHTFDASTISQVNSDYPGFVEALEQSLMSRMTPIMNEAVAPIKGQLETFTENAQKQSNAQKMATMKSMLSPLGIDFDKTNNDPDFSDYLSGSDVGAGATRQDIVDRAFSTGDLDTVAFHVKQFASGKAQPAASEHIQHESTAPPNRGKAQPWSQENIDYFLAQKNAYDRGAKSELSAEQIQRLEKEMYAALG